MKYFLMFLLAFSGAASANCDRAFMPQSTPPELNWGNKVIKSKLGDVLAETTTEFARRLHKNDGRFDLHAYEYRHQGAYLDRLKHQAITSFFESMAHRVSAQWKPMYESVTAVLRNNNFANSMASIRGIINSLNDDLRFEERHPLEDLLRFSLSPKTLYWEVMSHGGVGEREQYYDLVVNADLSLRLHWSGSFGFGVLDDYAGSVRILSQTLKSDRIRIEILSESKDQAMIDLALAELNAAFKSSQRKVLTHQFDDY